MKKRFLNIFLLFAFLLSGCSYRVLPGKKDKDAPVTPAPTAEVLSGESEATPEPGLSEEEAKNRVLIRYRKEWQQFTDKATGELLLDYSCVTPEVTLPGMDAQRSAIQSVLDKSAALFEKGSRSGGDSLSGVNAMEKAARKQYASEDERDYFMPYALNRSVRVSRADAAVLSFIYVDYSFAGGIHGYPLTTGLTFDTESGAELSFDDLAADPEGLRALCFEEMRAQAAARGDELFEGYEETLPTLMDNGRWYFTEKGLAFVANPYDIAPYASGNIEFTVSYKKLSGLLHERYQRPAKAVVQGGIEADWISEKTFSSDPVAELTLSPLAPFALWAENTVYNVRLSSVTYLDYSGSFEETEELLFASRMDDGEYWRIAADIPDVIPNLMLSWQLPDGTVQKYLISMSGMNGSLLLIDPNSLAMIQPGELQPNGDVISLAWDLNGDSNTEFLSVESENALWNITVSANGVDLTQPTVFTQRPRCFVADVDGDGCFEMLLCGRTSEAESAVFAWRYTDKLDKVPFTLNGEQRDYLPCTVLGVDTDEAVLSGTVEILGKCTGTCPFSDGPEGTLAPAYGSKWDLSGNQKYINTAADLSFTAEDGTQSRLIAGTRLRLTAYDGKSAIFETESGIRGRIAVSVDVDGRVLVNGKSASLLFDGIT